MKAYYSLLSLEADRWCIQFGDYDRDVVMAELRDWKEREPELAMRIVRTEGDGQAVIDATVAALNL